VQTKVENAEPFAKNLFLGKFDKKMLVYPEVLSKDELEEMDMFIEPLEKFFFEDLDCQGIDVNAKIPEETLKTLGELGLFGQQIPQEYGGLALNATKYARIAEITSHDASVAVTLAAHQAIGLKGILIAGNDEQKAKYLPKLATGEHIAAFALTEPSSGSDAASIQTKATLSEDGKHYLLNGGKIWISNGGIAEIFTVFAKTEHTNDSGEKVDKVTAFIVERGFGGISNGKPEDKLGIRGSNTCEVYFDNTPVPIENVIGSPGAGFKIAMNILNSGRFSMGSSMAGQLKRLTASAAEHATTRSQFGTKLKDFGLIQEKFAKFTLKGYGMESMAYMTAGILDNNPNADASVEAAMVKIYSSENSWDCMSECLQILGGLGYMKSYPYERYLRDSRICLIFEGTNEILRMYIALTGMQHAGKALREMVKKLKDPLNNFGFLAQQGMKRMFKKKLNKTMDLDKEVHPRFAPSIQEVEIRLVKFQYQVEDYLGKYRDKIIHEQLALKRFADISINLYACTAVIARASRSMAIGLQHHDQEALIATTFVQQACKTMDKDLEELQEGNIANGDENIKLIAEAVFKNGGYVPEHPLKRNW